MAFKRATLREFRECIRAEKCPISDWTDCYTFEGSEGYEGRKMFRSVLPTLVAVGITCGRMPRSTGHRCGNKNCVRFTHLAVSFFDNPQIVSRSKKRELTLDTVTRALAVRPVSSSKYTLKAISRATGIGEYVLKGIMRLAPVFDIMAEVEEMRRAGVDMATLCAPLPVNVPAPVAI